MKAWIYFAQFGAAGPIKIGRAYDPHQRVKGLSCCAPAEIFLLGAVLSGHAEAEEKELHACLRKHHIRGEWFEAAAAMSAMECLGSRLVSAEALKHQKPLVDGITAQVAFRVRGREIAAWKRAAKRAGIPLSQWARNVFNRAAASVAVSDAPIVHELPFTKPSKRRPTS